MDTVIFKPDFCGGTCMVFATRDIEYYAAMLEAHGYSTSDLPPLDEFEGACVMDAGYVFMILPEHFCSHTIYHECLHAVIYLYDRMGARLNHVENDEVLAHAMNGLAKKVYKIYDGDK